MSNKFYWWSDLGQIRFLLRSRNTQIQYDTHFSLIGLQPWITKIQPIMSAIRSCVFEGVVLFECSMIVLVGAKLAVTRVQLYKILPVPGSGHLC